MPDEQWLAEVLKRPGYSIIQDTPLVTLLPTRHPTAPGHASSGTYRSKTEARYAAQLDWRVACGEVRSWLYEPLSLRLGVDCHYRPDFLIEYVEPMLLTFVEVKGAWIRNRAMDKPRAAATRFPMFTFVLAQWQHQTWTHTRIQAHA